MLWHGNSIKNIVTQNIQKSRFDTSGEIDTIMAIKISNHFTNMEHEPSEDKFLEAELEEEEEKPVDKWDDTEEDSLDFINEYKLEDEDEETY